MRSSAVLISSDTCFISASSAEASCPAFCRRGISSLALLRWAFKRSAAVIRFAALLIDGAKRVEIDGHAAVGGHFFKFGEVFAKISEIVHAE